MYTNYNIPQKSYYKPINYYQGQNYRNSNYSPATSTTYYNDGDRFIGGGVLAPFLLGGVGGYLLGRPNYGPGPGFGPGPIPVYFPPGPGPYPVPYSNTNIYY